MEKFEKLTNDTQNIIIQHLTKGDNSNSSFLLKILGEHNNIKKDILSNIENKFIISEEKFLNLDDENENENYKLLNGLLEHDNNILKNDENTIHYIKQTNEIVFHPLILIVFKSKFIYV